MAQHIAQKSKWHISSAVLQFLVSRSSNWAPPTTVCPAYCSAVRAECGLWNTNRWWNRDDRHKKYGWSAQKSKDNELGTPFQIILLPSSSSHQLVHFNWQSQQYQHHKSCDQAHAEPNWTNIWGCHTVFFCVTTLISKSQPVTEDLKDRHTGGLHDWGLRNLYFDVYRWFHHLLAP